MAGKTLKGFGSISGCSTPQAPSGSMPNNGVAPKMKGKGVASHNVEATAGESVKMKQHGTNAGYGLSCCVRPIGGK